MELSIIITVYNKEKWIRFCLDSVLNQSLSQESYEIIVVDDCSTDNSLSILREYERKYPNLKVILSEINRGLGASWNVGFQNCNGNWIHFVDADDFVVPNVYKDLLSFAKKSNADMIGAGYYRTSYHDFKHGSVFIPKDDTLTGEIDSVAKLKRLTKINSTLWAKLFSRALLERVSDQSGNIFSEILAADGSKHLDIVYNCKVFDIYSKPIYYYWQHAYKVNDKTLNRTIDEFHCAIELAKEKGYYSVFEDEIIASCIKSYAGFIRKMFGFISNEKAYQLILRMHAEICRLIPGFDNLCEEKIKASLIKQIINAIKGNDRKRFRFLYLIGVFRYAGMNIARNSNMIRKVYDNVDILRIINRTIQKAPETGKYN